MGVPFEIDGQVIDVEVVVSDANEVWIAPLGTLPTAEGISAPEWRRLSADELAQFPFYRRRYVLGPDAGSTPPS